MAFVCFLVGFIQTLMIPMVLTFANSKTVGIMESLSAVGMLIGSVAIGIFTIKKNYVKILMISLMLSGIFMSMVGTTTSIIFIICSCFLFFTTLPFINTCVDVLIRINIPNEVQGRAWGIISLITQSGCIVAYAACGLLADYVFGPMLMEDGILSSSVGNIIGTGAGRGIGFMIIIAGISLFITSFVIGNIKSIRSMEKTEILKSSINMDSNIKEN